MDTERLMEILMYNITTLTEKISFYQEQGISTKKINALQNKKAGYQQALIDIE